MDELIKAISEKLGVTPDKAAMAVQMVIGHLKAKSPALAGQIEGLMAGGAAGGGGLGDVAGTLGGLMGGKE